MNLENIVIIGLAYHFFIKNDNMSIKDDLSPVKTKKLKRGKKYKAEWAYKPLNKQGFGTGSKSYGQEQAVRFDFWENLD